MTHEKNNVVDLKGRRQETKEQVLERLFHEHGAALRKFLRGRTGSDDDLEDVVQDVFLRLAKMDDLDERMKAGQGNSRAFIFTAANNLVVDLERRKAVRWKYKARHRDEASEQIQDVTPERMLSADRDLAMVKRVIMKLRPNCRRAFVLNRFENMSYPQVADTMGISVKQVEKLMSSALVKLRDAARRARETG